VTIHGKQLRDSSVADGKLATLYIKADGTRAFTGDQSLGGFKITNLANGSAASDAVNYSQLTAVASGVDWKDSVRVATAAALPANTRTGNVLTADANGALAAVDGVTLVVNERLLVKDEATPANNGIYYVSVVGTGGTPFTLTRTTDADTSAEVTGGAAAWVNEGSTLADTGWILTTNDPITLNTTSLSFTQFTGLGQVTAGAGLTKTGNTLDVGAGDGITVNANDVAVNVTAIAGTNLENDGSNNLRIAATAAGDGLDGGGAAVLSVNVTEIVGTGLESDGSNNIRIATSAAGNGLTGGGGAALAVLANATTSPSVEVGVSGVKAAVPRNSNKHGQSAATSGNEQTTTLAIAATPSGDGYVEVLVNGVGIELGDAVKTKDGYFSADAGVTARAIAAIATGDTFYWNGTIAGYDLATTDYLDFHYNTIV
jgi:hypothetical protein